MPLAVEAMPEAPDLEVIKEFLSERATGALVSSATVIKPSVLRSLTGDLATDIEGRSLESVARQGKFLVLSLSDDRLLVFNPTLTGAFQYCLPETRVFKRTCIVLSLLNGHELRYLDDRQMGFVYYVTDSQLE